MKFSEPKVEGKVQDNVIIFSALKLPGQKPSQQNFFANFKDECFVLADGARGLSHDEVASSLAGETAIWGYKHIRQRRFYWVDKKLFIKRIFRSCNIAVWQKHREAGFEAGLSTSLLVVIVGPHNIWLGSVGNSSAYLYHQGKLEKLTREDRNSAGKLTKAIGATRYGMVPAVVTRRFAAGDLLLLTTDSVAQYITTQDIQLILSSLGSCQEELPAALQSLFLAASNEGSLDNMSACIIKRLPRSD